MKSTKTNKGITLIALIITIVVLLILAVVAISSITNDGILHYAQNAASSYNQAQKNEAGMLNGYLDYLNQLNQQTCSEHQWTGAEYNDDIGSYNAVECSVCGLVCEHNKTECKAQYVNSEECEQKYYCSTCGLYFEEWSGVFPHSYSNGFCDCGDECIHPSISDGVYSIWCVPSDGSHEHEGVGSCDICELVNVRGGRGTCEDNNNDGNCDVCNEKIAHLDENNDGQCDACGYCVNGHVDEDDDQSVCDICGCDC